GSSTRDTRLTGSRTCGERQSWDRRDLTSKEKSDEEHEKATGRRPAGAGSGRVGLGGGRDAARQSSAADGAPAYDGRARGTRPPQSDGASDPGRCQEGTVH